MQLRKAGRNAGKAGRIYPKALIFMQENARGGYAPGARSASTLSSAARIFSSRP